MQCPKCGSNDRRKAGFIGENQRWLCKGCGCKYTRSTPRGIPTEVKRRGLCCKLGCEEQNALY